MKNYVLYARLALEQQTKECASLDHQIKVLQIYAKRNNLQVSEVFTDVGSALSERAGFNNMLKRLSEAKFRGIICNSIDRLTRDVALFSKVLVENKGLEIVTPTQTYNNNANE